MKTNASKSTCCVSYSLNFFGDRWTILILRDMMFDGKKAFIEFLHSDEKIASNILNDRLRMLLAEGFVNKRVSPDNKSKFLYSLTDKAIDLLPMIMEIQAWGEKYNPNSVHLPIMDAWAADKEGTNRSQQERLRREREIVEK